MNHSSLFSFEESSVWDPKVIRKHLVVSQDQLTKLNLIPEPGERKELLFMKEINARTMEAVSQLPVSIPPVAESANLCFETAEESIGGLTPENTAARPNISSDQLIKSVVTESMNVDNVHLSSEIAKETNGMLPAENVALCSNNVSNEPTKSVNESMNVDNSVISVLNQFTESPVSVSTANYKSDSSCAKEVPATVISVSVSENVTLSLSDQVRKVFLSSNSCNRNEESIYVVRESIPSDCSTDITNKAGGNLNLNSLASVPDNCIVSDNFVEKIASKNVASVSSVDPLADTKSLVLVLDKCTFSDNTIEKAASKNVALFDSVDPLANTKSLAPTLDKCIVSSYSVEKIASKNAASVDSIDKECDSVTCDPAKFVGNDEASLSKKRKLESRNRRSKRLKSEEKQSKFKRRSIKHVSEICYSVEDTKTMLDIIKQYL